MSAYPTAGGIYWWAATMGRPVHGWFTGWLNLIGLVAVTASVDYGCATFLNLTLSALFDGWAGTGHQTFGLFVVILALHGLINIYGHRIIDVLQNVSVWWHVAGAAAVVLILVLVPDNHQSFQFVFTERFNNSGFGDGDTGGLAFWFYVLPLGFLLTQYTITGFDACAHVSEETRGASKAAAQGLWRSIFYSAVGGWILLLAFLFAATDVDAINEAGGFSGADLRDRADAVLLQGRHHHLHHRAVLLRHELRDVDVADGVRVQPRPGGARLAAVVDCRPQRHPGQGHHRGDAGRAGAHAARALPARRHPGRVLRGGVGGGDRAVPVLHHPDLPAAADGRPVQPGPWTLGRRYKLLGWIAVVEIAVISIYFVLPIVPAGVPGNPDFSWTAVNYAPIAIGGVLLGVAIWWYASARKWFTGPRRTVDQAEPEPEPAEPS